MKKTRVPNLEPGMIIGKDVYNDRGDILLARGVTLTPRFIEALDAFGYYAVYVMDGIADDIEPPDILADRVRIATGKHLRALFTVAQSATNIQTGVLTSADLKRGGPVSVAAMAAPNVAQLYRDVERIMDEVLSTQVVSGVSSLKSHDSLSFDHSVEVAVVGVILGQRLKLRPEELHQLALGCLCHDIGKVAVPLDILTKQGPLSPEEYASVQHHPQAGYEIMRQITTESDIVARHIVWQHHERQDGAGYPRGLVGVNEFGYPKRVRYAGKLMLPSAEIAALAEVYCALVSDMCYRPALPTADALSFLQQMAGRQLNREIVRKFLAMVPSFPIGTEVVVKSGEFKGHRGVVSRIDPINVNCPTVRLLFNPRGERIAPLEIDTGLPDNVELGAVQPS